MTITNGTHEPIVKECIGCSHAEDGICKAYFEPAWHWRHDKPCPAATHVGHKSSAGKERVGQQHQRKRPKFSKKQQQAYARIG